jgi:hypothetical protein
LKIFLLFLLFFYMGVNCTDPSLSERIPCSVL